MQAPIANPLNLVASKPANSLPSLARSFELYSASSAAVFIPFMFGLFEISTIFISSYNKNKTPTIKVKANPIIIPWTLPA